jgi:phage-related protein
MVWAAACWKLWPTITAGTWRAVYTVSIGDSIYVVHAFRKKSKAGIATPPAETELIRQRLQQLRNEVKNAEKKNA